MTDTPISEEDQGALDPNYADLTAKALEESEKALAALRPPQPPRPEDVAERLRELGSATYLYGSLTAFFDHALGVEACQNYLTAFLKDAGDPRDPVERLLLEQLVVSHHVLGRLQVHAAAGKGTDQAVALLAGAVRLMAEFRRTALALKAYRQPPAGRPRQGPGKKSRAQAVGANSQSGPGPQEKKTSRNGQVGSNNRINGHFHEHAPAHA